MERPFLGQRRCAALTILAAMTALAAGPTAARAGEYEISQCHDAQGNPAEVSFGFLAQVGTMIVVDRCGLPGGQLEMSPTSGTISPASGPRFQANGLAFKVPDTMSATRIKSVWVTMSVAPKLAGAEANGTLFANTGSTYWTQLSFPATAWPGFKDQTFGGASPAGTRVAEFTLACNRECVFEPSPTIAIRRAVLVLDDAKLPAAPRAEALGLLDGTPQRGVRTLRFAASDADSGVRSAEVHAPDGTLLASTVPNAGCSYARPAPCPQQRPQEELVVDTAKVPDGPQVLELWVTDAGGNVLKTPLPSVLIANAQAPTPAPQPTPKPAAPPTLTFAVSSKRPKLGSQMKLSGRVLPAPVATQRVIIEAKKGKRWITAAVVRTRKGGTFRWSHRFRTRGEYRMRARLLSAPGAGIKPPVSPTRTFRVR